MYKKVEELLPSLLKRLSRGESLSTIQLQRKYKFSSSSIRAHLRSLRENFFKKDFRYDASTKKWVCIQHGFLDKILLKPEEIVVLNSILRNRDRLGVSLRKQTEGVVEKYLKRTSSFVFKQRNNEEIDEQMEERFALAHTAIDQELKLNIIYKGSKRVIYPYKVVNIEYYWYLLAYEESKQESATGSAKIKFFALYKIENMEISKENFMHDFENLEAKIEHIMNAYFSPKNPITYIQLLVSEDIAEYMRAKFFASWIKSDCKSEIEGKSYTRYEVKTSDDKFRDIVPTILKYMPNILVEEPQSLKDEIMRKLDEYKKIYEG